MVCIPESLLLPSYYLSTYFAKIYKLYKPAMNHLKNVSRTVKDRINARRVVIPHHFLHKMTLLEKE